MKRFVRCALALACAPVAAEQLPMEHVLVTVPMHKTEAETALPLRALTGDELRRAATATIGQTLANMPGVSNASFGPGVGQPVIRGQQGPRVTVLQNGTTSADAASLSADHAVAVEALLADSIEVLRGPSTLLYGGGAIGGVVNVIDGRIPTRPRDELSGGLEYRHDTASDLDVGVARLDGGSGNFAFHADAMARDYNDLEIPGMASLPHGDEEHDDEGAEGRSGLLGNTAGEASAFTLGGSYHFERGFAGLSVNRLENDYGIPAGAHSHDHGDEPDGAHDEHDEHGEGGGIRLDVEQTRYDGALHLHDPLPGLDVARVFVTYTDYEHAEIEGDGAVGTVYRNESWESRLELVHRELGDFHGVFGLQARSGEFSALGEEAFIPVTDYRSVGVFWLEDWHRGDWTVETGVRLDRDERDPDALGAGAEDFLSTSVSATALWDFRPDWQAGIALSRAERAPSIEELFSNVDGRGPEDWVLHAATDAVELGDPALDTEVSHNMDLSLRWASGGHSANVAVFYNQFNDYINLVNTGAEVDGSPVRAYTQADADFYGFEFDSEFTLGQLGEGTVFAGVFGDLTRGELDGGEDVPRLPPLRLGARLAWSSESLELWTRVVDAAEQDRPGLNEEETAGWTRWDLGLDYRPGLGDGDLSLFVTLNNITDEEIRLATSFLRDVAPEAGFGMEAGLRYRF